MHTLSPDLSVVEGKWPCPTLAWRCQERRFTAVRGDKTTMPSAPAGSERFARSGSVPGDAQIESLRLPPHSVEAEQAVLGRLFPSNSAREPIGDVLSQPEFYPARPSIPLWPIT